jgi:hypothetical protein
MPNKRGRTSFEVEPIKKLRSQTEHIALAEYPTQHLLHLLAGLLQRMATSNDARRSTASLQTENLPVDPSRPVTTPYPRVPYLSPIASMTASTSRQAEQDYFSLDQPALESATPSEPLQPVLSASKQAYKSRNATLGFHARNIPGIGIEQYLMRILKCEFWPFFSFIQLTLRAQDCPTTNEVFISLLVYFERMAHYMPLARSASEPSSPITSKHKDPTTPYQQRAFCVDSYNVHRLVIAGITVASKFFSDVFYTNSRYAKVGGLPLHELNQLELQFLLLNDFSLVVPVEELQEYADRLLLPSHSQPSLDRIRTSSADGSVPSRIRMRERQGSESTSGSSTIGGRSETSSVASSTGTVTDRMDVDPQEHEGGSEQDDSEA